MNDGILLINKRPDWTSSDVCRKVKHLLKLSKVGHTGTLDPFADGLLVLTINKGTKCGQFIECLDKVYVARLKLGELTDTLDVEGKIIKKMEIPKDVTKEKIQEIFKSFLGEQEQIPPMYSAIKVDGKPLYEYAREGKNIKTKPRHVEIKELILMNYEKPYITFLAHVSKGTYIRTLGSDIASALGTCGYLENLSRTQVGRYFLKDACDIDDVNEDRIISIKDALAFMPKIKVNNETIDKIKNGMAIRIDSDDDEILVLDYNENPLAVYSRDHDTIFKTVRGLF